MTATLPSQTTPITLTDAAVVKVAALLAEEDTQDLALRVAVRPGGCSGFSYEMWLENEREDDDVFARASVSDGSVSVPVVVDATSAGLLQGATLDYRDGLNDSGFHVTNPNATRTCGCGNSFC